MRVGVAVIVSDPAGKNHVLLGKRLGPLGTGCWGIPGGKPEPGETLAQAARRELREETGLIVPPGALTRTVYNEVTIDGEDWLTAYFKWLVLDHRNLVPRVMEPEKHEDWGFFPWWKLPTPLFAPLGAAGSPLQVLSDAWRLPALERGL